MNREQGVLAFLLFVMMVMNYLDRQALSVVAPMLRKELGLSVMQYANAVNAFLFAYSIMYTGSGIVLDRIGYRWGLAIFVGLWSVFSGLHSLTAGFASLVLFRLLLGLTEPAGFTGAVKTIALRFAPAQRALATATLGMGTGLGNLLAPPVMIFLSLRYGWRTAFLLASTVGVIWVPAWLMATRARHVKEGAVPIPHVKRTLPRNLGVLAYVLTRFFGDSSGYFVMFWMPEYLMSSKHFSFRMIGTLGWIPPCGSDLGAILGGYLSSRLVARGYSPLWSRKILMSAAALLLVIGAALLVTSETWMVLFSLTICTLGVGMWACNMHALATDAFPRPVVATVHGTAGSAGAIGGIVFNSLVGYFSTSNHYGAVLVMLGLILPIAVVPLWLWLNQLPSEKEAQI
jgi:ACS family hexuronate transporter-like MFS transporter